MQLTLTIENVPSLPDGGPLSISIAGKRGLDFGRDRHLDWSLPDPSRIISGKHCEVRYQDGEYLLYDVSTNGTFLNGAPGRMQSPHRLTTGDRLSVGHYLIAVAVDRQAEAPDVPSGFVHQPAAYEEMWDADVGEVAPPIDPRSLRPPGRSRPLHADFLDTAASAPAPEAAAFRPLSQPMGDSPFAAPNPFGPSGAPPAPDLDWAPVVPREAPAFEPPPEPPRPRRAAPDDAVALWAEPGAEPAFPAADRPPAALPAPPPEVPEPVFAPPPPAPLPAAPVLPVTPAAAATPAPPAPMGTAGDDMLRRLATAAGIPPETLAGRDPGEVADTIGALLREATEEMMKLLSARGAAKRLARSSNQTMIQALDNNPLKFSPSAEEALRIMLGPPTRSYLDARRAFTAGFGDLKTHQLRTYSAMQQAARLLAAELDPGALDRALPADSGLGAVMSSRRARLWDSYVTRWQAKTLNRDDGMADVFMQYFAECYDRDDR